MLYALPASAHPIYPLYILDSPNQNAPGLCSFSQILSVVQELLYDPWFKDIKNKAKISGILDIAYIILIL